VLSDCIGSADDLCTSVNAVRFRADSDDDLLRSLEVAAQFDAERLRAASMESRRLAARFGPERFGREIVGLIREFGEVSRNV
jgi:hypothetical protein